MNVCGISEVNLSELPFPQLWNRHLHSTHLAGWLGNTLQLQEPITV